MTTIGSTNYGLNDSLEYLEFSLDSLDAITSGDGVSFNSNWPVFWLPKPLNDVAAIKIIECQIPFSYYVFNSTNNVFTLTEIGGATQVTIPVGNYNTTTIITTLQTILNAASPGSYTYVVTYNVATQKFQITQSGATVFSLTFGSVGDQRIGSVRGYLGFSGGANTSNGSGVLNSTFASMISGPNYVYVNSNLLGGLVNMYLPATSPLTGGATAGAGGGTGPQVAKVPITVNPGGISFWSDPDPQKWFDMENLANIPKIDFYCSLGDIPGVIDFNGQGFSLKLGVLINKMVHNDVLGGGYHNNRVFARNVPRGLRM